LGWEAIGHCVELQFGGLVSPDGRLLLDPPVVQLTMAETRNVDGVVSAVNVTSLFAYGIAVKLLQSAVAAGRKTASAESRKTNNGIMVDFELLGGLRRG